MSPLLLLFCVWFGGLLLFHQLEQWLGRPVHATYHTGFPRRRGYVADAIWSAVNGPGLTALEKIAFTWGVVLIPTATNTVGHWPWAAQFLLFLVVTDFGRYWLHRWFHVFNSLWRVHRVHHTIVEMDAMSVFRQHTFEMVCKNFLLFLPLRLIGIPDSVIIAFTCIDMLKGFWHHANLRTYIGPLNYVLNSAELHWWHHAVEARGQNANYGSILSIWDWIFGTAYWPRGEWPAAIGVEGMDSSPDSFVGQFASFCYSDDEMRAAAEARGQDVSGETPAMLEADLAAGAPVETPLRMPKGAGQPTAGA